MRRQQHDLSHRGRLRAIAARVMRERGLEPVFSRQALEQAERLQAPEASIGSQLTDLRKMPWCSIDNDDSLDLDQLSVAHPLPDGGIRVRVAIADVSSSVPQHSPIDQHAERNTTSVYTPAEKFPMLPDRLSTDLTSLNPDEDRIAMIIDFTVSPHGRLSGSTVYRGLVRNKAKLAYAAVGAWLEGAGPLPSAAGSPLIQAQLRLQDAAAVSLQEHRARSGALELETIEVEHRFDGDRLLGLARQAHNRATSLIANLMIASNGVTSRFLEERGFPVIRRVVRTPEHWDLIRVIADEFGSPLPAEPSALALSTLLVARQAADPTTFPDFSLTIIKLLGRGEYVVDAPGKGATGHFALAVRDYSHSTAPNRRFPDLLTQRLLLAAIAEARPSYEFEELRVLARHCTDQEDAANRVERHLRKSAAALVVEHRIGERFDAFVTGASEKGSYVRVIDPMIEGRLVVARPTLNIGDHLSVRLVGVNVERGFIDFEEA
jgi:VacB/RNase II family 3'-5' exoribonuclease